MALAQSALFIVTMVSVPPSDLPLWAQSAQVSAWFSVVSTKNTQINPTPTPAGTTGPASKINTWGGFGFEVSAMRFWLGAAGGHGNYSGNEVDSISFLSATPDWVRRREPTTAADVTVSSRRYKDGRPSSTHIYWNAYFIQSRNQYGVHGPNSVYGDTGGVSNNFFELYDVSSGDWVSAAACPSIGASNFFEGSPKCMDDKENIYAINTDGLLMRMNCSIGAGTVPTYTTIGNTLFGFETGRPLCYDPVRARLLRGGTAATSGWYTINVSTAAISAVSLTGFTSFTPGSNSLVFDTIGGQFLCVDRNFNIAAIHPTTFVASKISATGNAPTPTSVGGTDIGLYNRCVFVSALGGLLCVSDANQNAHYLKLYDV